PHDGCTLVEQALDALLIEKPGRAIAMSTGNYFTANVHAAGQVAPGESFGMPFDFVARDEGATEVEVWYAGADRFTVELVDPAGESRARVAIGEDAVVKDADRVLATIYHRPHDPNNGDHQVDLFLHPGAPAGRWAVRLHGEQLV